MQLEQSLKRISLWGKVFGILMMVVGAIYIPVFLTGLLYIFPGYFLYKAGDAAGRSLLKLEDEESKEEIFLYFAKYLYSQFIVALIGVVLAILFLFFIIVVGGV